MTEALTWMAGDPGKVVMTIGVVAVFGIAALWIETRIDKRRRD